ncbi:hypothetical protein VP01_132g8 [Puccinia sorghi]|uniref:beta-galactosidase n=1 Tax=Puccinia sorghi TaxID=27349 RepID=A0A0L6VP72_9BASI|nr:hypothetical protein VP01_132g8 [Puccinia sorghi]
MPSNIESHGANVFIAAETTAGGIPGWVTTLPCHLRTNATLFERAWRQYWDEMIDQIVPNQFGLPNGTVVAVQIENEYLTDAHSYGQPPGKDQYMQDLAEALIDRGIVVPLTVNDAGMESNFVTGTGAGDIYGFDSYPQSFDCSRPIQWKPVVESYRNYQDSLHLDSPLFLPEYVFLLRLFVFMKVGLSWLNSADTVGYGRFQAGAYDSWGATGYENCRKLTGPEFQSVFYLNNLAANTKMINYYMVYGGTNWGQLAFPGTYTSCSLNLTWYGDSDDYGSAISEDRTLTEKYTELKRQSFFLRSSDQFYQTEVVGDSKHDADYFRGKQNHSAFVTELRNPTSGAGFYIVRALNSTSTQPTKFKLNILTSLGLKQLPEMTLSPRESRLLVTDYETSSESENPAEPPPIKLLYTTSNVLLSARIGGHEVLYLFSNNNKPLGSQDTADAETSSIKILNMESEFLTRSFPDTDEPPSLHIFRDTNFQGYREINWRIRDHASILAVGTQKSLVLMTSKQMAGEAWNPILAGTDSSTPPSSVLIWGPWLVRNASIGMTDSPQEKKKKVLRIWGDFEEGVKKKVIIYVGGLDVGGGVEWNGKKIRNLSRARDSSFLSFIYHPNSFERLMKDKTEKNNQLTHVGTRIDFQALNWTYRDSLPEIHHHYSDHNWTHATLKESSNPYKKLYGKYYLYACDYGFCNGATIWRGHFEHKCNTFRDQHEPRLGLHQESLLGINMTIAGGDFFAASVWLNDVFLGSVPNATSKLHPKVRRFLCLPIFLLYSKTHTNTFLFAPGSLNECGSNVITVVQDSMGMDQTENGFADTVKHPRGILGYGFEGLESIEGSLGEITWKVQGHLGGFYSLPDPERGIYNENGFYGIVSVLADSHTPTRSGWHLPDHEKAEEERGTNSTRQSPISDGMRSAGVGFYSTRFELDFVGGYDVMLSFVFREPAHEQPRYRVEFWVNGWHMGNYFALTLWALDQEGAAISGGLELVVDAILEGGLVHNPQHSHHHPYNPHRRLDLV